ncbi:MAG: methyltransferase domain-containing protein [Terracidiphilus sp.]|nr:methyltransferase domain-containing protein [Terracidiphilus sp.]
MNVQVNKFYEELADYYHLIFEDWDSSIKRQAGVMNNLLIPETSGKPLRILDCACGIGTQSIGLAMLGHQVVASDLCEAAVLRARTEAQRRGLTVTFHVSDMTSLREVTDSGFDVVVAMDNALPHLSPGQLGQAAKAIASKLRSGGLFLANIRDYDALILERPRVQAPAFYGAPGNRRIVHQVWDWDAYAGEGSGHVLHVYITVESEEGWKSHHFVSTYRCLLRQELSEALSAAGFEDVRWLMPAETGSYQPMVWARLSPSSTLLGPN